MNLFTRKPRQIRRIYLQSPTDCGTRILELDPRDADAVEALQKAVEALNTEAEQTALAAVAMHRRHQETIAGLRGENKALQAALGTARDEIRQLGRELDAEKTTVEDLRVEQRRAVEHLRVCERAQAVEAEDLAKRVSNR